MPEALEGKCHARQRRGRGASGAGLQRTLEMQFCQRPGRPSGGQGGADRDVCASWASSRVRSNGGRANRGASGPAAAEAEGAKGRRMGDAQRREGGDAEGEGAGGESRRGTLAGEEGGRAGKTATVTRTSRHRSLTRRRMNRLCKITNNAHLAALERTMQYFPLDSQKVVVSKLFY